MHEEGGKEGHCEDWRETLLMNTGRTNQPSEESLQSREEQSQPRDDPGQRDSLDEGWVSGELTNMATFF